MPISLRIPAKKEEIIRRAAKKAGKTKTGFILEAVDEKLGLTESREQLRHFLTTLGVVLIAVDDEVTRKYALIFSALTAKGTRIPINDVWIAASCMSEGGTLVTRDRHFH